MPKKEARATPAGGAVVWERPEPRKRPAPRPLSRERIVEAALTIADAEGLAAVSLRNVAARLRSGPMRLYGYTATKDGLLDLMVDEVYGEIVRKGRIEGSWRDALRTVAGRRRDAAIAHPWFGELLGGRPHLGPHALTHQEEALRAVGQSVSDIDLVLSALRTVDAYVIGMIRAEAVEQRAQLETGLDKTSWQLASFPYVQKMISTGAFPFLARVVASATHPSPKDAFDQGLEWVLDGVAIRLNG